MKLERMASFGLTAIFYIGST